MSDIVKELVELENPLFMKPDMSRYRHLANPCNRLLLRQLRQSFAKSIMIEMLRGSVKDRAV